MYSRIDQWFFSTALTVIVLCEHQLSVDTIYSLWESSKALWMFEVGISSEVL